MVHAVRACYAGGLRDAEHGDDAVRPGDLDLANQRFDERFTLGVGARADDLVDVGAISRGVAGGGIAGSASSWLASS